MADISFSYIRYYSGAGATPTDVAGLSNPGGTLTDNDGGSIHFETTDSNMGDGVIISPAGGASYMGSFTVGAETLYVVRDDPNDDYYVYGGTAATAWPGTLSLTSLTTTPALACFAVGTQIATPKRDKPVETLTIGDRVLTASGASAAVKWIGRQTVSTRFGPAERLLPVRFAAGSLGDGLPHTDLMVTADHGMLVGGVICHAGALVNGTTITQVPLAEMGERYTVYHIETDSHEIILANGAPAETFIDNVSRRAFDNYAEFEALYGDVSEMQELPMPRAMSARQVPIHIRNQLSCALTG